MARPAVQKWLNWILRHPEACRRALIGIAIVIVAADWARVIVKPQGDFPLHWTFAHRFVEGQFLYAGGLHTPYPPFWAMANVPLTFLPLHAAQIVAYPISLIALAALLTVLHRLTRERLPLAPQGVFWATALALFLASRFIKRELVECGPNLALLALTWIAIYCWTRRRELLGGGCLGLAIALKLTPAIFLAYLVWKRQWRMAAFTVAAAGLFTLAPVLRLGYDGYSQHTRYWAANVWRGVSERDPSRGVLGEEKVQNFSLRPALARLLMRYPHDHPARQASPFWLDVFNFPPPTAGAVVRAVLAALIVGMAWAFRRPVKHRDDPAILWECAAISVLALLYSPITWGQHCVAVLPACYLIARMAWARGGMARWMLNVLAAWTVGILLLNYGLIGKPTALLLHSFHVTTWMLVLLLVAALNWRRAFPSVPGSGSCTAPQI